MPVNKGACACVREARAGDKMLSVPIHHTPLGSYFQFYRNGELRLMHWFRLKVNVFWIVRVILVIQGKFNYRPNILKQWRIQHCHYILNRIRLKSQFMFLNCN